MVYLYEYSDCVMIGMMTLCVNKNGNEEAELCNKISRIQERFFLLYLCIMCLDGLDVHPFYINITISLA